MSKSWMLFYVSKVSRFSSLMFYNRRINKKIKLSSIGISFKLFIPTYLIKFVKPFAEFQE